MACFVGSDEFAVDGDLDCIADNAHSRDHSSVGVAGSIGDAGKTDRALIVDAAQHLVTLGGSSGRRPVGERLVGFGQVALGVGGNHDAVVSHVEQSSLAGDLDSLSDKGFADVVAKTQHRDSSLLVDDATQTLRGDDLVLLRRDLTVNHFECVAPS